ncbi:MAG: hypothetical protein IPJ69_06050 [Deltaproteobacteria bacterium]|nr:MAG: hypothetical protein IPJ69_06050 [Deltaproteobacteria bacterium]
MKWSNFSSATLLAVAMQSCAQPPEPNEQSINVDVVEDCSDVLREGRSIGHIMNACRDFAHQTIWVDSRGDGWSYDLWSTRQKNRLEELFGKMRSGDRSLGIACRESIIGEDEAFDRFAAGIAYVFYEEGTGQLPWSIRQFDNLAPLLNSSYKFSRVRTSAGGPIQFSPPAVEQQTAMNCDPRNGLNFLLGRNSTTGESFIRNTPEKTLGHITEWLGRNVVHLPSSHDDQSPQDLPQMLRVTDGSFIAERLGCHTAASIMAGLSFSALIPVYAASSMIYEPISYAHRLQESIGRPVGFLNIAHGGLIYGDRVVWHADDMNAIRLAPFYPIDTGGHALSGEDRDQEVFDAVWLNVSALTSQGFGVQAGFPLIQPGSGYGQLNAPLENGSRYEDYGRMIGYWRQSSADPNTMDYIPAFQRVHTAILRASLGSFHDFVDAFCYDDGIHFNTIMGVLAPEGAMRELNLSPMIIPSWSMRASRMAFVYGGCTAVNADAATIPIINSWRD